MLGAATGAIAIGTAVMSILTTTIILIRTTISIAITLTEARAKVSGSTTRNTGATHLMAIGELRISSAVNEAKVEEAASVAPEDLVGQVVRVALVVPEDLVVRVASAVPESLVALAVPENLAGLAVPESLAVLAGPESLVAVPEQETGPALGLELAIALAAVPETGQLRAHRVAPERIKSVIARLHPGRAHLAAEASAAVAETMRVPAAAEAAIAWAVAVTAVVAAADVVVVE